MSDMQVNFKIKIISFGYKHGQVTDASFLHDVRFLPNPFYVDELKHKTGLCKEVRDYVKDSFVSREYIKVLKIFFDVVIPSYTTSSRQDDVIIAIGCTGGRHRSVTIACEIYDYLREKGYNPEIFHRDIEKA